MQKLLLLTSILGLLVNKVSSYATGLSTIPQDDDEEHEKQKNACLEVKCETLQGKCSERSDLEGKILLSDGCDFETEYCKVNNAREISGICAAKNFFLEPMRLFPEDPCSDFQLEAACHYGLQTCENNKCASVGHEGLCSRSHDCPSY